jgi:AcrR family transcriptional regulator
MSATAIIALDVSRCHPPNWRFSVTVISYDELMARWEPNARERLRQAALELYGERGFEQTTVAEIARRAGLTERTFFRYFTDKPEVLFYGSDALQEGIVTRVASAPASDTPLEAVTSALEATAEFFDGVRDYSVRRQAVIEANSGLRERELIKMAKLASAIAVALRERSVSEPAATLAAEAGIAAFKTAFQRWVSEPQQRDFAALIRESIGDLKAVTADR